MVENNVLRTKKTGIRYGSREIINGEPVVGIKNGKKQDFISATEIIKDLYGSDVEFQIKSKKQEQ